MLDRELIINTIDRSRHRVLVVDDDPSTRYTTTRLLQAAGFRTAEAGTGAQALALAREQVSIMVLDVQLPDFSGFEVARRLRADPVTAKLPIMHLSAAFIRNEDQVLGLEAGADAYLIHPVEPAVLIATVQALIRARTAEDQLRASEARFRTIYDHAHGGIALVDSLGRFSDVNPALTQMLGRERGELLARGVFEFAPPEWFKRVQERVMDVGANSDAWQAEFPLVRPDGSLVFLDWRMSAHIEHGLRIGIAQDVTQRTRRDQDRQQTLEREQFAREVAEKHGRSKDDFIAVLSHELRTPLNTIAGWVHLLTRADTSAEVARGLEVIDRNVKLQSRIIADILDVSRINSGKLRLECAWSDAAELVAASVTSLRVLADNKGLVLAEDLQDGGQPAWLDPQRFQQICWNLLTNAIKFSHAGGTVHIRLRRAGDVLTLTVQDYGQGVEPAFLPRMFERFTQSASPNDRHNSGLGLGLAIVAHLADLHHGSASATSAGLGQGTTVQVLLNVAAPSSNDAALAMQSAHGTSFEHSQPGALPDGRQNALAGLEVLVVEDDPDSREVLAMVLLGHGAHVRQADSHDAALAELAQGWPQVLISDVGMPGKDGHQLIAEIRRLEHQAQPPRARLPAIALTAFARAEDEAKAMAAGFDLHLPKPLRPDDLVRAITQLLGAPAGGL